MATSFLPQNSSTVIAPEAIETDFFGVEPLIDSEFSAPLPETIAETTQEQEPTVIAEKTEPSPQAEIVSPKKRPPAVRQHRAAVTIVKDQMTAHIEKIMEEGIGDAFMELTTIQKQEFKIKGEETAKNIKALLQASKIKIKKIFELVMDWLKLLPGINKFFLMQEAKIKTDKILALKNSSF
jgi:hypothetical protein